MEAPAPGMERRILLLQTGFILLVAWLPFFIASVLYFAFAVVDTWDTALFLPLESASYLATGLLRTTAFILFVRLMGYSWHLAELLVFAVLLSSLPLSPLMIRGAPDEMPVLADTLVRALVASFESVIVVIYLITRSGWPLELFGITNFKVRDSFHGIAVMLFEYLPYFAIIGPATGLLMEAFPHARGLIIDNVFGDFTSEPVAWTLLVAAMFANSVAEEGVFRATLIPMFERLLGSTAGALVLSSVLFASYHLYQGLYAVWTCFTIGVIYGLYFVFHRRLWPLIIAHTLTNILLMSL